MPSLLEISDDVTECVKRVLENNGIEFDLDQVPGKEPPHGWEATAPNWKAFLDLIIECLNQKNDYEGFSVDDSFAEATRFIKLADTIIRLANLIRDFVTLIEGTE